MFILNKESRIHRPGCVRVRMGCKGKGIRPKRLEGSRGFPGDKVLSPLPGHHSKKDHHKLNSYQKKKKIL